MDAEIIKQRQLFLDAIVNYEFLNENGRLDLELFCVTLSNCFAYDDILDGSPYPSDVYDLLIELLEKIAQEDKLRLWVQSQNLTDWNVEDADIYPNKGRTYIHVGGLIQVFHDWIWLIGHKLMGIPEPVEAGKYHEWVKEEWLYVFTFIGGFHDFLFDFAKKTDMDGISEKGFSIWEAYHAATTEDVDFDEAVEKLKLRHLAHRETQDRISLSIKSGFYLEAIALQECLISNCLFNYIAAHGKTKKNISFNGLIKKSRELSVKNSRNIEMLFDELNTWRKKRNASIHGFVSARRESLSTSRDEFASLSTETAQKGVLICETICKWYEQESVDFVKTKFPKRENVVYH